MPLFHLTVLPPGEARESCLPLLLLADESLQQVRSYMNQGDLYVWSEDQSASMPAGMVLAIPVDDAAVELKAVAIDPQQQGRGTGTKMLSAVLDDLRRRGYQRAVVGTANAAIGQLAFYQKAGFRLLRIERDFFSPQRGYPQAMVDNGIALRDMVWMDQPLQR